MKTIFPLEYIHRHTREYCETTKKTIITAEDIVWTFPLRDKASKKDADFRVEYNSGKIVIEDTKGMETPVFKIKRKLFWMRYPDIDLQVIS